MNRLLHIATAALVAAGVALPEDHAAAPKGGQPARAGAPRNAGGAPKAAGGLPKMGPRVTNPANPVARLYRATPDERERALEKLPPAQQERIRAQLKWFDGLRPEQQAVVLNRAERLAAMPPEKRSEVRQSIQDFQHLPADRKPLVGGVLRRLQNATEEQRKTFLSSPRFLNDFSPEEQKIIVDLAQVMQAPQ